MLKPGTYTARVTTYGIAEKKENQKAAQVVITFAIDDNGEQHTISAYKSLSAAALEYTIKDLLTCGLKSNKLSSLLEPGAFREKEVSLVLDNDTYEGKTTLKVKWINEVGGAAFKSIAKEQASQFDELTPYIANMRKEMGIKAPATESDFAKGEDFDL